MKKYQVLKTIKDYRIVCLICANIFLKFSTIKYIMINESNDG